MLGMSSELGFGPGPPVIPGHVTISLWVSLDWLPLSFLCLSKPLIPDLKPWQWHFFWEKALSLWKFQCCNIFFYQLEFCELFLLQILVVVTGLWPWYCGVPLCDSLSLFLEHGADWFWYNNERWSLTLISSWVGGVALERELFGNPHLEVRSTSRELFPRCCWAWNSACFQFFLLLELCLPIFLHCFQFYCVSAAKDHVDFSQHAQSLSTSPWNNLLYLCGFPLSL